MTDFTERDREMLTETHTAVTTLLERVGENGKGLCGTVQKHETDIKEHEKALHKLWVVVAFAAGGGGIAGGTVLSKLIGG